MSLGDEVTCVSGDDGLGGLVSLGDNNARNGVSRVVGDAGHGGLVSLGEDVTRDEVTWVVKDS